MKKIQKNTARFQNLKQDLLEDKKYSSTAEATGVTRTPLETQNKPRSGK